MFIVKKEDFFFRDAAEEVYGREDEISADYNVGLSIVPFEFLIEFKRDAHIKQESLSFLIRIKKTSFFPESHFAAREAFQ